MVESNQPTDNTSIDEISISELFNIITQYKYSIFFITVLFSLLSVIYAYFATSIYKAHATLEVKSSKSTQDDFMSMALGIQSANVDNEIEILKSRWIINKAQNSLNLNTRYFTTDKLKKVELYKNSPFIVQSEYIHENIMTPFQLEIADENGYYLSIKPSYKSEIIFDIKNLLGLVSEKPISYNEYHTFGEKIVTPWFNITLQKVFKPTKRHYSFSIYNDDSIYQRISQNLSVNTTSKLGTILAIQYKDNNPERAKEIVNAITKAYLEADLDSKNESATQTLHFLDTQLNAINKTLQLSAKSLEQYKATNVVIDISSKAQLTAEKLGELESQRYELDMQLDVLANTLVYIQSNKDLTSIDLGSVLSKNPTISTLILKLQDANTLQESLLIDYTELHPDVIKVNQQLITLKNTLINTTKSSISSLQERKNTLVKFINENSKSLESLPQQERELARLNRSFLVNEKIYSFLLQKRAETAIIESSTVSETRIIDEATVGNIPVKPKRSLLVIIGTSLGLIFALALAFIRNYINNTITSSEDIEKRSNIPVYGVVPERKNEKYQEHFLESLRVVRTNLEFIPNKNTCKLITLTSSIPGEGKTTLSSELANIIASGAKKVLLIDLDMRRARIHERFNIPNRSGISNYLAQKCAIEEILQKTQNENLHIITAGTIPPNPSELLMSDLLKKLIFELRTQFDYILLDSPPVGLVTDAMLLMKMSDVNLFVLKAKYSKRDFIHVINKFVHEHQLRNAGFILNGMEVNKNIGYGYGYGYNYKN